MTFWITDLADGAEFTSEAFCDGQCEVVSRSGLNITEAHLTEALALFTRPERLLILGNRTGALGLMATQIHTGLQVIVSSLDVFHHHAVERNLLRNRVPGVTARCEPYVAERNQFDAVCLQVSKGTLSDELIQDLLQQSHLALKTGGQCYVATEEKAPWLAEQMRKRFGKCSIRGHRKDSTLLVGKKKQDLTELKTFRAEFTMTLPNRLPVTLATIPGVFAHRRVDPGAQALAEVAETQPGDAILDMGCGCGSIGISLAKNQPTASVCFVDSHSRAIAMTEENCRANGLARYEVILSDQGAPPPPRFTLFVGTPPYYSHDRITDVFIRAAYESLIPGGRAYIVAKNVSHHVAYMKELFGDTEILHRRGYQVVKVVKT